MCYHLYVGSSYRYHIISLHHLKLRKVFFDPVLKSVFTDLLGHNDNNNREKCSDR